MPPSAHTHVMPPLIFRQAHGQTLSTMLPHVIEFNLSHGARVDKYALVAEAFGVADKDASDADNAKAAVEAVAELSRRVGTARSIVDMGGSETLIAELTRQALIDTSMTYGAVQPNREEVEAMYRSALEDPVLYPQPEMATTRARL